VGDKWEWRDGDTILYAKFIPAGYMDSSNQHAGPFEQSMECHPAIGDE
jgi:hypothetical protein